MNQQEIQEIIAAIERGGAAETAETVLQTLKDGADAAAIIKKAFFPALKTAKRRLRNGEILLPDFLAVERAINLGIAALEGFPESPAGPTGAVEAVAGCLGGAGTQAAGIEKNIAIALMRTLGLSVADLGGGLDAARFIEGALREKARTLVCFAGLTGGLHEMKNLVRAALESGANSRDRLKIILSGGPVTGRFCQSIGADFYAPTPLEAAALAQKAWQTTQ